MERTLTGVIRPEMDERALDREAGKVDQAMGEASRLTPDIDVGKLRRKLEGLIPGGRAAGRGIDRVTGRGQRGGETVGGQSVQAAQLKELRDINKTLKKQAVTPDGDGGGGGLLTGLGLGRVLAGGGAGAGAGGLLSGLLGGGTAAMAGGAGLGALLGLGGVGVLNATGVMDQVRGAGQGLGEMLPEGGRDALLAALGPGAALGAGIQGLVSGGPDQAAENMQRVVENWRAATENTAERLKTAIGNVDLPELTLPDIPDLGLPDIPDLGLPDIPELGVPDIPDVDVNAPSWLQGIADWLGGGTNQNLSPNATSMGLDPSDQGLVNEARRRRQQDVQTQRIEIAVDAGRFAAGQPGAGIDLARSLEPEVERIVRDILGR